MGFSLTWKPTDPTYGTTFAHGSGLGTILNNTFGSFPATLTRKDIDLLKGMVACGYSDLEALIDAIDVHESVDVLGNW